MVTGVAEFPAPGRGLWVPDFDMTEIDSELAAVEGDPFDVIDLNTLWELEVDVL